MTRPAGDAVPGAARPTPARKAARAMNRFIPPALLALAVALSAGGCGSTEPTGPKQTLSEQDKQQIKELDEQREQEWGPAKKTK